MLMEVEIDPEVMEGSRRDEDVATNNKTTAIATTTNTTGRANSRKPRASASPTDLSSSIVVELSEPRVCRQYIYDRIYGASYIPRERRKSHASPRSSGEEEQQQEEEDTGLSAEDDPTSCLNRPPHRWCWVPTCVRWCPGFLEQNSCCACMGRVGFHSYFKNHHLARRRIFTVGLVFNGIALCLMIVSCMAFSLDSKLLKSCSFLRGYVTTPEEDGEVRVATINIGFRAVSMEDPDYIAGGDVVSTFTNFCEDSNKQSSTPIQRMLNEGLCGSCQDKSGQFVLSCLINIILIMRNMISDFTRMYPKYDLNCPNFHGSLMSTMSVFLGLLTIMMYQNACFQNMAQVIPAEDGNLQYVIFNWYNGPGLDCLITATFLRFVDALANYIVPTPSITRSLAQQQLYEIEFGDTPSIEEEYRKPLGETRHSEDRFSDDCLGDDYSKGYSRDDDHRFAGDDYSKDDDHHFGGDDYSGDDDHRFGGDDYPRDDDRFSDDRLTLSQISFDDDSVTDLSHTERPFHTEKVEV